MASTNSLTRIQLIGDLKGYLDLDEKTVLPLTYAISDIRDLSKKKSVVSKSIVLPSSKNNNKLLNYYFDVNIVEGSFNINKLQYCNVIQNGIIILENALIQLISVNKEQTNNMYEDKITYTVLVKDKTADFFTIISNKYLKDISGFTNNVLYTAENVIDSFDNTYVDGYKFIMPFNPSLSSDTKFELTEFSPGIYARRYFDKIFSNAGYQYSWPEMDNLDVNFSKLIIPYNGDVIRTEKTDFVDYKVIAKSTGTTTSSTNIQITNELYFGFPIQKITSSGNIKINIQDELLDISNSYTASASTYNVPNIPSSTNNINYKINVTYEIILDNPNGFSVILGNNNDSTFADENILLKPNLNLVVDNAVVKSNSLRNVISYPVGQVFPNGITTIKSATTTTFNNTQFGVNPDSKIWLNTTLGLLNSIQDTFYFRNLSGVMLTPNVRFRIRILDIDIEIVPEIEADYGYNVPININRFVPDKIKQSDFIKSIFTMYNCYVTVDKDNPNQLNIVSRDKYYDDGKTEDWTKKLVKDKTQELKFLPELQNKKYLLTYKEDGEDVANNSYKKATGEIYGQLEYTFDNEYVKDKTTPEIIFSPTPTFNTPFGAVCPMWAGGAPKNNIRILYDGGQYYCSAYTIYNYWLSTTNLNVVTGFTYPHISHWDKPINPTFDLNFGVCSYYYRTDNYGALTNNNLFNLHWRRTLNQINSGKLLTAYFNLNETDIQRMKLNDKIRIDNSYWNINKIQDYDANSTSPTKVELITIDDNLQIPYSTRDVVQLRRNDPTFNAININTIERNKYINNNVSNGYVILNGQHNFVGDEVTSGIILGDNNVVTNSSFVMGDNNIVNNNNSLVFGNNNTLDPTTNNSFIFGNNITAESSNTFYVDNVVLSSGGTFNNLTISGITSQLELVVTSATTSWRLYNETSPHGTLGDGAIDLTTNNELFVPGEASGISSFAINSSNRAIGVNSFAAGFKTTSSRGSSVSFGTETTSDGINSFSIGFRTLANGDNSFAIGDSTDSLGDNSFTAGIDTTANNINSFAIGDTTTASGPSSISTGINTTSNGTASFTTGYFTIANGDYSFASGYLTTANGNASTTQGNETIATGYTSHAQGNVTKAYGDGSFSSGGNTIANGDLSFIHSLNSVVNGDRSVVLGGQNITGGTNDTVYVPNFNINYAPTSTTGTTSTELLLRESDGTIKVITVSDLATLLGL